MRFVPSIHRLTVTGTTALSLFLALAGLPPVPARANISGFGTTGTGFTLNQGQSSDGLSVSGNVATLTNGSGSEGNSLFDTTKQTITAFNVSFTYQDKGSNGVSGSTADGFTFTLQNDTRGAAAVGGTGNSLGYAAAGGTTTHAAVTPSVAVGFNIYNQSGTMLGQNGTFGTANSSNAVLYSGDAINVSLSYANKSLTETLTDASNPTNTSTFTYSVDIANIVGANTAYVGFTGGDGGVDSTQTISNFSYTVVPEPATWANGLGVVGLLGLALRRRHRRARAANAATASSIVCPVPRRAGGFYLPTPSSTLGRQKQALRGVAALDMTHHRSYQPGIGKLSVFTRPSRRAVDLLAIR